MEYEFLGEYMARLLNDCIGMTIESIGSLEVPLAFESVKKAQTGRLSKLWLHYPSNDLRTKIQHSGNSGI